MIYTCTMNPAIDLFVLTEVYDSKVVNRTLKEEIQPNGKGVNISFILRMLGISNTAIGFSGGFTGDFIQEELSKKHILTDFVGVEGITRINVFTHVEKEKTEYKLVNKGPEIKDKSMKDLLEKINRLTEGDILFVSGSLPLGVKDNVLVEISQASERNKFKLILDTSSKVVLDCLQYQPYCIKPNEEELAEWFGKRQLSKQEIIQFGNKLVELGAENVLVSLGKEGCLFFNDRKKLYVNAPKGKVINTACSGDTLLGTFIGRLEQNMNEEEALMDAVAAGSSTAFSSWLTDFSDIDKLKEQMKLTNIKELEGDFIYV